LFFSLAIVTIKGTADIDNGALAPESPEKISRPTTTTTILLAKNIYVVDNIKCIYMTAGCQESRSPSMLAAYNCVLIIADDTNKEKKRTKKNITCNSIISLQP